MTNVTQANAEFSTEAGVNITMFSNNTEIGQATADEDGNWSIDLTAAPLTQGQEVDVVIADLAGNQTTEDETVV
jgi:hypothetical protein